MQKLAVNRLKLMRGRASQIKNSINSTMYTINIYLYIFFTVVIAAKVTYAYNWKIVMYVRARANKSDAKA